MDYRKKNATSVTEALKFSVVSAVPSEVIKNYYVRFHVLMTLTMKITIFWDVIPCSQ